MMIVQDLLFSHSTKTLYSRFKDMNTMKHVGCTAVISNTNSQYYLLLWELFIILCDVILLISYLVIHKKLNKDTPRLSFNNLRKQALKITKIIVMTYVFCHGPVILCYLLISFSSEWKIIIKYYPTLKSVSVEVRTCRILVPLSPESSQFNAFRYTHNLVLILVARYVKKPALVRAPPQFFSVLYIQIQEITHTHTKFRYGYARAALQFNTHL